MNLNDVLKDLFSKTATIQCPLHGGMMNKSFIVYDKDKKYVLYIPTKQANEMVDRTFEKHNQKLVYDVSLTSKNIYFDTSSGIKVNEYIEGVSLNHAQTYNYKKIADLLKTMHNDTPLTYKDYNPFEKLKEYEKERKTFFQNDDATYLKLKATVYNNIDLLKSDRLCLSHNDFQRSNIIQTPEDNYFVIDFEFMANNYEMYDIACFANDKIEDGLKLVNEYINNPTADDYKKFYLWRIYISLQWYNVALIKHYRGEGKTHNIDFLAVGNHFINIANECFKKIKEM